MGTWKQTNSTNRLYKLAYGDYDLNSAGDDYNAYSASMDNLFNKVWEYNVINVVADYEATGDGSTDDTTAWNNAIIAAVASGQGATVEVPPGTYVVSSIDVTELDGLIIRGLGNKRVEIIGKTADKNVLDLTGSRRITLENLTIKGDSTNVPKVGILMARESAGGVASRHTFKDIETEGNFSVAAVYNYGSEKDTWINCILRNEANSSYVMKIENDNPDSITSDFCTIETGGASTTSHNFYNTTFWAYGTSSYAFHANTANTINLFGGAIATPGITSCISMYVKELNHLNLIGVRFEKTANTALIRFGGNVGHVNIIGGHVDHATNSIDADASTVLTKLHFDSQLVTAGNTIDLSNAQIIDSYIYYGTKSLSIGASSVDSTFEGTQANFTDGASTNRIIVKDNGIQYMYGGVPTAILQAVDPSIVPLVKLHGTANNDYAEILDSGDVSRHQFAASGWTLHSTTTTLGRETVQIDQNDEDKGFIDFAGTSAADSTKNISTQNGDGAVSGPKDFGAANGWTFEGMIKVEINGTERWMPYYSEDTS